MKQFLEWVGSNITNRDVLMFFIGVIFASLAIRIAS
jgi:hypothetical protein